MNRYESSEDDWVSLSFKDAKHHVAPLSMAMAVNDDLVARDSKPAIISTTITVVLDQGGMCYADRPYYSVFLDGLEVKTPAEHVGFFLSRLKRLDIRQFPDGRRYVKLHGYYGCLVLTPGQSVKLVALWSRIESKADARADEFYRKKHRHVEARK